MSLFKKILYGSKVNEMLSEGIKNIESENYNTAEITFKHILEIDPRNEDALFYRAKACLELKRYEEAKNMLEQLDKINSSYNEQITFLMSKTLIGLNEINSASKYSEQYYLENSNDVKILYYHARVKYLNREFREALSFVEELIKKYSESYNIWYLKSLILFELKNLISALVDIDKAIKMEPLNGELYNFRGIINVNLLNNKDASEDFENAVRLSLNNDKFYFNRAVITKKIGDFFEAEKSIDEAIKINGSNKTYYLLKGELNLLMENKEGALLNLEKAYQLDEENYKLANQIAELKIINNKTDEAKNDLTKILEKNKNDESYLKLASLAYSEEDSAKAEEYLTKVCESHSDNLKILYELALLEFNKKNYNEALKYFDEIISLDRNYKNSKFLRILVLEKSNQLEKAIEELEQFAEEEKSDEYFLIKSKLNSEQKNFEEAEENINKYHARTKKELVRLIQNTLKIKLNKFDELQETIDAYYQGYYKDCSKLMNSVYSFSKNQYGTARYRIKNISALNENPTGEVKKFIEFAELEIS